LTLETLSVHDALGIDPDEAEWQDFALCAGQDVWRWYEGYEQSSRIAKVTDEVCLSCPVRKECLSAVIENGEWGCWGGVFLSNGKVDKNKNAHKTVDIWNEIREGIG
jgi:hypothetical protein